MLSSVVELLMRQVGTLILNSTKKILNLPKPQFEAELAQSLFLSGWVSPAVPGFAEIRDGFSDVVRTNLKKSKVIKEGRRIEWNDNLDALWSKLRCALKDSAERNLSLFNAEDPVAVFTDASKKYYSVVVTQYPIGQQHLPVHEQDHRPLIFLSGKFTQSQRNWHVSSLELYPIVHAFKRLDFLLYHQKHPVELFTDHRNLVFILRPETSIKKSHLDRLTRWSLLFQDAKVLVRHIDGTRNVVADLLSRWGYLGLDRDAEDEVVQQVTVNMLTAMTRHMYEFDGVVADTQVSDESLEVREVVAGAAGGGEDDVLSLSTSRSLSSDFIYEQSFEHFLSIDRSIAPS